jgi:nucleotide-binding universal stress UspA family protein
MIKRILVPVDFSAPSLRALDYAVELGRALRAKLVLLHAVEPVSYAVAGDMYGLGMDLGNVYLQIERAARARLAGLAGQVRTRRAAVRAVLASGTAHQVILDTAKASKADLIVMSTHGRSGLSHVLIGSVAERVIRTATCPVLTIPDRSAERSSQARRRQPPRAPRQGRKGVSG